MKNTTDLISLRINFFRQMNDFIEKNGDNGEIARWKSWIMRNTFEQVATTITQDDDLWSGLCELFNIMLE